MARQVRKVRAKGSRKGGAKAETGRLKPTGARRGSAAHSKLVHERTLAGLVTLTSRLFARALHDRLVPHGVAPGQLSVLQRLWEGDGLTQAELARAVRVEQPTMARTLDRMERDDLIARIPSKQDRRAFNVRLTSRGRALRRAVEAESRSIETLALGSLKRTDRGTLARILGGVAGSLGRVVSGDDH
ncbi:MAG TPA: MarR family transcriptional regulator [Alphaproteobacteria bacterium]|nr:MarR family transcriptional regulator [Alphaproteobacteria bacterium]